MRPALLALPVLALSTPAQAEDLQTWLEAKLALEPLKPIVPTLATLSPTTPIALP